jgi:hypothetical protein
MSENLPTPPPDAESQAISHQADAQPGSLLRLRDVQALNRSFRRLAEVQEALLTQMQQMERERGRQRAWMAPVLAISGIAGGLGLAAIAFVWWRSGDEPVPIEVAAAAPIITIEPTPVTVHVPEDPAVREAMDLVRGQVDAMRSDQQEYREQLTDLTERLLLAEREKLDLLAKLAAPPQAVPEPAARDAAPAASLQVPGGDSAPADPWVGVVNGLAAMDGYSGLKFQKATRVPGEARLESVVLLEWNQEGQVAAVIRAARVEFALHRMTANLVLRFHEGYRTASGVRVPLPAEGLRLDLDGVNADAWIAHFPELAETGAELAAAPAAGADAASGALLQPAAAPALPAADRPGASRAPAAGVREIQRALDGFLAKRGSFSYYRLNALGGVEGTVLQLVQINWHDNSGRLVKTIEADSMLVRLHEKNASVELELHNGAFLDNDVKHPFSDDVFRLHLPRQDLAAWRASGIPCVESTP